MRHAFESELAELKQFIKWLKKHPKEAKIFLEVTGVTDENGKLTKEYGGKAESLLTKIAEKRITM